MPAPLPINRPISPDPTSNTKPATLSPKQNKNVIGRFGHYGVDQIANTKEGWFFRFVQGFHNWFNKISDASEQGMSASTSSRTPQRDDPVADKK